MTGALLRALSIALVLGACAEPESSGPSAPHICRSLDHPRLREPIAGARSNAAQAFEHPSHRREHCGAMELELERTVAFTEGFFEGARGGQPGPTIRTGPIVTEMTEARVACDRGTRSETLAILERMDRALAEQRAAVAAGCR